MTAYAALFGWSFLAATILPLASEPMLIALVRGRDVMAAPVLVATLGNYLGACTTWWLARQAARRLTEIRPGLISGEAEAEIRPGLISRREHRAAALLRRFGAPALLLSWVPLLGDAIVVVAGGAGMPFGRFSLWTVAGKVARYAAVAMAASRV